MKPNTKSEITIGSLHCSSVRCSQSWWCFYVCCSVCMCVCESLCILKLFHSVSSCWLTNKLYKTSCAYRVVNKYFALLLLVVSLFSLFRRSVPSQFKKADCNFHFANFEMHPSVFLALARARLFARSRSYTIHKNLH